MKLCIKLSSLAFPVTLEQHEGGAKSFRVTYGKQVSDYLSYESAARKLGECIMHALACDGALDNGC